MTNNHIVINNIYYMLSYAFKVLNQANYDQVASEVFENVHDLMGAILSKGIAQQLKQGLYKEYVEKIDDLSALRGKINFPNTIRNRLSNKQVLSCEYDELSENNIYNQIIKTTIMLLLNKTRLRAETKNALKKEMLFFSTISEIDLSCVRWSHLRFSRNNQNYQMLITVCQFIYEGLLITTESGEIKIAHFFDEQRMCRLYEKFILEFYRKEIPLISANASKIEWQIDGSTSTMLPSMQSDIMLKHKDKTLIIDAKYYSRATQMQFGKRSLHSANVYQIFTYVKNEDVGNTGNVAGMLLYAKTDEDIVPDEDVVISGNRISAKTLDLNCNFETIKEQLMKIASDYFEL